MTDRERTRATWYGIAWLVLLSGGSVAFVHRIDQVEEYPHEMAAYQLAKNFYTENERHARSLIEQAISEAAGALGERARIQPDALDAALQKKIPAIARQSSEPAGPPWPEQYDATYIDSSHGVQITLHFAGQSPQSTQEASDAPSVLYYTYGNLTRTFPAPRPPFSAIGLCEKIGRVTLVVATFIWLGLMIVAAVSRQRWWEWLSWAGLFGTLALSALFYVMRPPPLDAPLTVLILLPALFTYGLRCIGQARNPLQHLRPGPIGRCKACGYDMTGNTNGICPECGTHTGRATPEQIAALVRSSARLGRIAHTEQSDLARRTTPPK